MSSYSSTNPKPPSAATSEQPKKRVPSSDTSEQSKKSVPPSAATSEQSKKMVPSSTTSEQTKNSKVKRESKINSSGATSEKPKKRAPKAKRERKINLCNYPFLMGQVSKENSTDNEIYKQGLIGLGEEILKGLDKKWKDLEVEEAILETRRAQLVLFESIMQSGN